MKTRQLVQNIPEKDGPLVYSQFIVKLFHGMIMRFMVSNGSVIRLCAMIPDKLLKTLFAAYYRGNKVLKHDVCHRVPVYGIMYL